MKKSQISIFIVLGFMVISLLVFLISTDVDEKSKSIQEEISLQKLESNNKLFPLKDNVDFCLEKNLRKATIIAGIRGGFIEENLGEYMSPSIIPANTYNDDFLRNNELNKNNLLEKTLVYHHKSVITPFPPEKIKSLADKILDNGTIVPGEKFFETSIKENFEQFILDEFITCLNLDEYLAEGYNLSYEKFNGFIDETTFKEDEILVRDLEAKLGDSVKFRIKNKNYYGKVIQILEDNVLKVKTPNQIIDLSTEELVNEIKVLNLNSSIYVDVEFFDESIKAKLNFPIKITKESFETSFETSSVSINVRFRKLLELAQILIRAKEINKTLDYTKTEDLQKILSKNLYLTNTKLDSFTLIKTPINFTPENKKVIYTIIDKESRILGNKFVFNFGYINEAPLLNVSELGGDYYEKEGITFITSIDNPIIFNLSNILSEKQTIDRYKSYFIPVNYVESDAIFTLNSKGELFFEASIEKRYTFEVKATDGESTTTQTLIFMAGFPDNEKNKAANECFSIEHFDNPTFPIEHEFKNKIFRYGAEEIKDTVYGYVLNVPSSAIQYRPKNSILKFRRSCQFNPSLFPVDIKINNAQIDPRLYNATKGELTIPFSGEKQEIVFEVRDVNNGKLMTDPYEITLYPAACLGPHGIQDDSLVAKMGGIGSCCNTESVFNSITARNPSKQNNILNNIDAINSNLNFCANPNPNSDGFRSFAGSLLFAENRFMWETNSKISSLLNGNLRISCKGTLPLGDETSITKLSGETLTHGVSALVVENNTVFDFRTQAEFGITQEVSICQGCELKNEIMSIILNNGLVLTGGFIEDNQNQVDIGNIPNSYFVRKDNKIYGSTNIYDVNSWTENTLSKEEEKTPRIYRSYAYCKEDSIQVPRYIYTDYRTDNYPSCTDHYLEGGEFFDRDNTGWNCGGDYTSGWEYPACEENQTLVSPIRIRTSKTCNQGNCIGINVPEPPAIPCP